MKNVNDFIVENVNEYIDDNWVSHKYNTLQDNMQIYKKMSKELENLKEKQKTYDALINSKEDEKSRNLTFKEQYFLYELIDKENWERRNSDCSRILGSIWYKIGLLFDELRDYLFTKNRIGLLESQSKKIIGNITLNCLNDEHFSPHCLRGHSFVVDGKELKCVYCGASTKDYPLTEEEFEFLVLCAKQKNLLLEEFTKKDWPLLQVIIEQQDYRRSLRPEIDIDADDFLDRDEEQFYDDEHEFTELRLTLARAHMLDKKIYDSEEIKVNNPKYLDKKQKKQLLENLEKEMEEIQKTDSRFKPLLIEQCKIAKYEILILSGKHIPTMLKEATNEDEKIALTKAYYNLSNVDFRINSGYFDPSFIDNDDIVRDYYRDYDCYTANPDINSKILEMKLRRK